MSVNLKNPLNELLTSLQYWYAKTKSRVTFEYVVWRGINDDERHIDALVAFCKKVPSKVNIIEYNPIDDGPYQQADPAIVEWYREKLEAAGIKAMVRRSRGKDIDAACGQLANKNEVAITT
jgi:23S rRNA (adenine2503-C2)-methyltransferase